MFADEIMSLNDSTFNKWLDLSNKSYLVNNGNIPKWEQALDLLKTTEKGVLNLQSPYLSIDGVGLDSKILQPALEMFKPWRKGPFKINELKLESEWQCNLKWQRLIKHIQPLEGKKVLDVGSGNGYFTLRMALLGAKIAIGIEPFLLFNYQFKAIYSLIESPPNALMLSLRLEDMEKAAVFNTVFSMGVLYHQKDYMNHLIQLRQMLVPEGEIILETLIVDGPKGYTFIPKDRYARMRNVHCLPSIETLKMWLKEAQFKKINVIDVSKTSIEEQRRTQWIGENSASLEDFLDPLNDQLTIEGLPAPKRVIVIAQK